MKADVAKEGLFHRMHRHFDEAATYVARVSGRPVVFALAVLVVVVWAVTGPLFGYSDTWQLVINTGTTIVTFLMVFLIQNSQNRDSAALQVKLDEIIRSSKAHNHFVGIEHLTEEEIEELRATCESRAKKKAAVQHSSAKNGTRAKSSHG
jgi:low affinity Fe/Cu permease